MAGSLVDRSWMFLWKVKIISLIKITVDADSSFATSFILSEFEVHSSVACVC